MLLFWASLLLFSVKAGKICRSVTPVDKGKEDPCNAKTKIADCYATEGCEWFGGLQKVLKEPFDINFGSNDQKPDKNPKPLDRKSIPKPEFNEKFKGKQLDLSKEYIMTYKIKDGKYGKVEVYKYNEEFVKYFKKAPNDILKTFSKFLIPENKPNPSTRRLASFLEIGNASNGTNGEDYYNDESIFSGSEISRHRRLLPRTARPRKSGRGTLRRAPFAGVGRISKTTYYPADQYDSSGWYSSKGTGVLISAVQEDDNKCYEYILTAGHNVYEHNLGEQATSKDKRHFSRHINFARGTNKEEGIDITNPADKLTRVWIGFYLFGDFSDKSDPIMDWAILKYEVDNTNHHAIRSIPVHAPDDHPVNGFALVGYNGHSPRQWFWNPVVVRDSAADIYSVEEYTRKGASGSPLYLIEFGRLTTKVAGMLKGTDPGPDGGRDDIHFRISAWYEAEFGKIVANEWDLFAESAVNWNWDPKKDPDGNGLHARDIHLTNRLMDEFDDSRSHTKSLHHKKKSVSSGSALDLEIPNHDINIHHYYHHDHGFEDKEEHDTYLDGYSEYNYDYEQTKLLLAIPLILLTICIVCIGCLCCAGFGGIAGWFIKHESKGSIKNRKNDYIQELNDNEVSEI